MDSEDSASDIRRLNLVDFSPEETFICVPVNYPSPEPPKGKSPDVSPEDNRGGPLELQGHDLTPHIITVNAGEDIVSVILGFSRQQRPRRVCILSAAGYISSATLQPYKQPTKAGTNIYEGKFGIVSLNFLSEDNSSGIGSLSLAMSGEDYRVYGGVVAGVVTAQSPIQIVLGSFICQESSKED